MPSAPTRRLLLVHAHPDDESIATGATIAKYTADPDTAVTLVTCTLGEEGEILIPSLAHLAADQADALGSHRLTELAAAADALGLHDWRLLGGAGTFRDSGMVGTAANDRDDCFWRADLLRAAGLLVEILREARPQVLVSYDDFGGYGHPDHIQAHRVAMYATVLAEAPTFRPDLGAPHRVAKIYWTAHPRSVIRAGIEALRARGETTGFAAMDPDHLPMAVDDEIITTVVHAPDHCEAKLAAIRAHATQISLNSGFFALSSNLGPQVVATEHYRLVRGDPAGPFDADGHETDLFAGV